uniref:Carboxyvinyl-carboxyphosphonate phosphorylmutase n=1 Tax=Paramoeba aestuarina TaxID=180227 RepID=A0A7S4NZF5_9EUKA|mmetsp:Transcript_33686/g.52667  ORF Transcript_33686/g.52667 Transcript_33686/m.52667 type:complete len:343 (+) Transcript_33686:213-1241(+)
MTTLLEIDSEIRTKAASSTPILLPATRLRSLLNDGTCRPVPCCWDGLTAKLIASAGFEIAFMSGFCVSAARGFPDCQLVSYEEMKQSATMITSSLSSLASSPSSAPIPVIGDGDTGYGGGMNVKRTVKGYAQAGLAAVMIEDQTMPKRCGHVDGKEVVSREIAFERIRAACKARDELRGSQLGDILILARTDARIISMDEAIYRCQKFREIGADITFLEAPETVEEMQRYCDEVEGPKMANLMENGKTPLLPLPELEKMGFAISVHPLSLLSTMVKGCEETLQDMKQDKDLTPHMLPSFKRLKTVVGFDAYFEEEKQLLEERGKEGNEEEKEKGEGRKRKRS